MTSVKPQKSMEHGKSSHHCKKNLIDLSILIEHIRQLANKFLIRLIYINVSQM